MGMSLALTAVLQLKSRLASQNSMAEQSSDALTTMYDPWPARIFSPTAIVPMHQQNSLPG